MTSEPARHTGRGLYFTSRLADIFDLHARLVDEAARDATLESLGLPGDHAAALLAQIEANQAFARLREVRDALLAPGLPGDAPDDMPAPAEIGLAA